MKKQLLVLQALGVAVIGLLIFIGTVSAQSVPRLKPLPPKKVRPAVTAQAHATAPPLAALPGSWQMLPNQPPVLDIVDCAGRGQRLPRLVEADAGFPNSLNISDGPGVLEPNGKVLVMASPGVSGPRLPPFSSGTGNS